MVKVKQAGAAQCPTQIQKPGLPSADLTSPSLSKVQSNRALNPHKGLLAEHVVEPQPKDAYSSGGDQEVAENTQMRAEAGK